VNLSGDTLPCEDPGRDTGTIKATFEEIEIIHKMLYILQKSSIYQFSYKRNFFCQIDDFNLHMIETVMNIHIE